MTPEVKPLLKRLREMAIEALEERRGLVAYSKMEAQEMDHLARKVEQEALEQIRSALPEASVLPEIENVLSRLQQMDAQLAELDAREEISDRSRQLERDDIIWRAFEEVVRLLGIE